MSRFTNILFTVLLLWWRIQNISGITVGFEEDVSRCVGNYVTLTCKIDPFTTPPSATWSRNGSTELTICTRFSSCTVDFVDINDMRYSFTGGTNGIHVSFQINSEEDGIEWRCGYNAVPYPYLFNISNSCTGGGGGGSSWDALIAGIIVAFIVIIVITIIICCLFNKRCRSKYLRKDSRFSFTCPGKDIVVMDINHDKGFKIVRPTGKKIEIQCVRTEKGCYEFNNKVLSGGNGVRVMNNPCMLFNPFFEICSLEMEHQGSYMYKRDNFSENGCILTMEICNDIVDIGLRPASFSAKIGDSIQIRYTREIIPQQLIFRAMRSGTNQIAPQPEVTKITDTAPLLIKEISKKDEGGYLFASSNGDPLSGILTLSVMKGNESKPNVYLGQSENGISVFPPRNGANPVLDALPKKEDIQENPDKKKKKKGKKKKEEVSATREEKEEVGETTNEEKDTT